MSHVIEVKQNPDKSWTASGGTSLMVVRVTGITEHKAVAALNAALSAIAELGKRPC